MMKTVALLFLCMALVGSSSLNRVKRQTSEEEQFIKDAEKQVNYYFLYCTVFKKLEKSF